jgi:hypothetical protein
MISHPKPRAEPVTMATLPSSFIVKPLCMNYKFTRIYNARNRSIATSLSAATDSICNQDGDNRRICIRGDIMRHASAVFRFLKRI